MMRKVDNQFKAHGGFLCISCLKIECSDTEKNVTYLFSELCSTTHILQCIYMRRKLFRETNQRWSLSSSKQLCLTSAGGSWMWASPSSSLWLYLASDAVLHWSHWHEQMLKSSFTSTESPSDGLKWDNYKFYPKFTACPIAYRVNPRVAYDCASHP